MMICSRDVGTLEQAAADIEGATGGHVETIAADLSRHADVVRVAKDAIARLGRLGVLVNNAGAIKGGDFLATLHDGRHRQCGTDQLHRGAVRPGREIEVLVTGVSPGPVKTERWDTRQKLQGRPRSTT
jgi:short-subunit dehydrogenase